LGPFFVTQRFSNAVWIQNEEPQERTAIKWMGFRLKAMGEAEVAIIEVNISLKNLEEGMDHSPLMELIFGVGKSLVSPKAIPPSKIKNIEIVKI